MSVANYIASDKRLKKVVQKNKKISVKKALKLRATNPNVFVTPDLKSAVIITPGDHFEIKKPYYSEDFLRKYTTKKYIYGIECNGEKNRVKLVEYLNKEMKKNKEIELWSIWLDEEEEPKVEVVHVQNLKTSDLKLFKRNTTLPRCLVVKNHI